MVTCLARKFVLRAVRRDITTLLRFLSVFCGLSAWPYGFLLGDYAAVPH